MHLKVSNRAGVGIALLFVALMAALPLAQGYWTWTSTMIGSATDSYDFYANSLAFSPATGYPATAYSGPLSSPSVNFAYFDGESWQKQVVDRRPGKNCCSTSLAFNPVTNRPSIAYRTSGGLKLANWTNAGWQSQLVDSTADTPTGNDVPLEFVVTSGNVHPSIAYRAPVGKGTKQTTSLRYAWLDGTTWRVESVDQPAVGGSVSMASDPNTGGPAIAYSTGWSGAVYPYSTLKFAVRNPDTGAWDVESITTAYSAGRNATLAYDNTGTPAVVDAEGVSTGTCVLQLWRRLGKGVWEPSEIAGPGIGFQPQLKFDSDGQAIVRYLYGGNYWKVMIARLPVDADVWTHEVVVESQDGVITFDAPSLALSNAGLPAVVYRSHAWQGSRWAQVYAQASR